MKPCNAQFVPGQRWVSEAEPELGLATVLSTEDRRVTLLFLASGEIRQYAVTQAPLHRVVFSVGDTVTDGKDRSFVVEHVQDQDGLLLYQGHGMELPENELDDQLVFNRPQDHLLQGKPDSYESFALRQRALKHLHSYRSSPLRGLYGGRIELIPHQLYVVESVAHRTYPRVLLSDEIGLGKTIEACLILHRNLMLGRVHRALILVPSALVHQWFVELLRRFSLRVAIFDEERCQAIEQNPECGNPFLEDQIILCDIEWLTNRPKRAQQAHEAGWDLVIVDEAHHLEWVPGKPSREYEVVERLSTESHGLLLLTATPEELGGAGHFARLRLLDPDRYTSIKEFEKEREGYAPLVPLAEAVDDGIPLSEEQEKQLRELGLDPTAERAEMLDELIDYYGPGRVIFRNTRRIIKGFPRRHAHLTPLENNDEALLNWLLDLLRELETQKVLAIVHTSEEAQALFDAFKQRSGIPVGLFHEHMNILERDRQAAWFADPDGARVLITSEIGGEGRNFQFAHHLVLLDIPENPEMVEQRIGRLDRIGQREDIHIHAPYRKGTSSEIRALWLHEALDALRSPLPGAHEIYVKSRAALQDTAWKVGSRGWSTFLAKAKEQRIEITERVMRGRARLLELHSYRAEKARAWVDAIRRIDNDPTLETFLMDLFEAHGVHPEQLESDVWHLQSDATFAHMFPAFPADGMLITFDRQKALSREDYGFITWDHPLVQGAMDLVLTSSEGHAAMARSSRELGSSFLVHAVFVLEATASKTRATHYLPPTPIHVILDDQGSLYKGKPPSPSELESIRHIDEAQREALRKQLPNALETAESEGQQKADDLRQAACRALENAETAELRRLHALQQRNDHISNTELQYRASQLQEALKEIRQAPLRLDSICCVWSQ